MDSDCGCQRACPTCGADLVGRSDQTYCSSACKQAAYRKRLVGRNRSFTDGVRETGTTIW